MASSDMASSDAEWMTAGEAREYLGVSKRKMWELLEKDHALAYERAPLDKRVKLVKRADVERLANLPRGAKSGPKGRAA